MLIDFVIFFSIFDELLHCTFGGILVVWVELYLLRGANLYLLRWSCTFYTGGAILCCVGPSYICCRGEAILYYAVVRFTCLALFSKNIVESIGFWGYVRKRQKN
jgi:hypothetical protein